MKSPQRGARAAGRSGARSMNPRVEESLLQWETALQAGVSLSPEELGRENPEDLPVLLRGIDLLKRINPVLALEDEATTFQTRGAPEREKLPTLPGYDLLEEIGRGGMGVVYRAWQHALGREVAIKIL